MIEDKSYLTASMGMGDTCTKPKPPKEPMKGWKGNKPYLPEEIETFAHKLIQNNALPKDERYTEKQLFLETTIECMTDRSVDNRTIQRLKDRCYKEGLIPIEFFGEQKNAVRYRKDFEKKEYVKRMGIIMSRKEALKEYGDTLPSAEVLLGDSVAFNLTAINLQKETIAKQFRGLSIEETNQVDVPEQIQPFFDGLEFNKEGICVNIRWNKATAQIANRDLQTLGSSMIDKAYQKKREEKEAEDARRVDTKNLFDLDAEEVKDKGAP